MIILRPLLFVVLLLCASCGGSTNTFPCSDDASCNLRTGGVCMPTMEGKSWCAYPDEECSSGLRFSEDDVGEGLAGTCTAGSRYTLTVSMAGKGAGTITSQPAGLTCSSGTCTGKFAEGTLVELSQTATQGSFLGWSKDCVGQGQCLLMMDMDHNVMSAFGVPGEAIWALGFGAEGSDRGYSVAVDGEDNVIVVGEFSSSITAGTTTLTSSGLTDVFVIKLASATGNVIWAKRFGGTGRDGGLSVAVDASNNIYVSGRFEGSVNFGTAVTSAGLSDGFVLKLAADGQFGWVRRFGGTNIDSVPTVAVRGDVVVGAGMHIGDFMIDTTTVTGAGGFDIFLVSMARSTGTPNWGKSYGGTDTDLPGGVVIDSAGNIVITGNFSGSANYGGPALQSAGGSDALLFKVSGSNGAHLFSKGFGGANPDHAVSAAIDASNAIFIVGDFRDTVNFGCTAALTAGQTGSADVFLVKLTQAGACTWAKSFGGAGLGSLPRYGNSVAVNATGDVAIAGSFCDSISFGGATFTSGSACPSHDVYAARFRGSDGGHLNSIRAGGTAIEYAYGVAQSNDGRYFMTGEFQGFAEFGSFTFTSGPINDIFVLGLEPL